MERVEGGATAYNVRSSGFPWAIAELLSGRAEGWYRPYQMHAVHWATFKQKFMEFFLSPWYYERLEDAIRNRTSKTASPLNSTSWSCARRETAGVLAHAGSKRRPTQRSPHH